MASDSLDEFEVPITVKERDGTDNTTIYLVKAKNEDQAIRKAKTMARIHLINTTVEDKSFGLIPDAPWWKFWRVRQLERGAVNAFKTAGVGSGFLIKSAINEAKSSLSNATEKESHEYDNNDLIRFRNNCIVSIAWYVALLIISIYLLIKGFVVDTTLLLGFINVYIFSGLVSSSVAFLLLIRAYKHLKLISKEILS